MNSKFKEVLIQVSYFISTIGLYLFGVLLLFVLSEPFPEYENIYPSFITVIGAIIGLIIIVSLFYMGKIHDYNRDIIKQLGFLKNSISDFEEISVKLTELWEMLGKRVQAITKTDDSKFQKINADSKNEFKTICTNYNKCSTEFSKIHKKTYGYSKSIFKNFILLGCMIGGGFVFSTLFLLEPTMGRFYFLIIFLAATIFHFLMMWTLYEHQINFLRNMLNDFVQFTSDNYNQAKKLKSSVRHIELSIDHVDKFERIISLKNQLLTK